MPVAKLHRILFFGLVAVILLQLVGMVYLSARLSRLEAAVERTEETALDTMEYAKEASGRRSLLLESVGAAPRD